MLAEPDEALELSESRPITKVVAITQVGGRLFFRQIPGTRGMSRAVPVISVLLGVLPVIAFTQLALTRPDLRTWNRIFDIAIGLGFGALFVWFGFAFKKAILARKGYVDLNSQAIVVKDSVLFDGPWELPMQLVRGVCVDPAPPTIRSFSASKRFPIDFQAGTTVKDGAVARYIYSYYGGSPLPQLGSKQTPNVAIFFKTPLRIKTLRRRVGPSIVFTEWGPFGADRPRVGAEYRGVLLTIEKVDELRRFFADRDLLLDRVPAADAEWLGATVQAERGRRQQAFTILGLMIFLVASGHRLRFSSLGDGDAQKPPACEQLEPLLGRRTDRPDPRSIRNSYSFGDLGSLLVGDGPPGFVYQGEQPMTLEQAANSRSDLEEGRATFRRYDYRVGYARVWTKGAVTALAHVFQFSSRGNAVAFETYASRYACEFSTEAFSITEVPGSIGLRIRYRDGTIADQLSFVRGERRYLVSLRSPARPAMRPEIVQFARQQDAVAR